jgi:hypothetical protein
VTCFRANVVRADRIVLESITVGFRHFIRAPNHVND